MPSYKYRVLKGNKTVALSTTKHEAMAEAKRIGGRVVTLAEPTHRENPYQETVYLPGEGYGVSKRPVEKVKQPKGEKFDNPDAMLRDYEYAFTLLAPKCMAPVAFYLDKSSYRFDYEGYAPDLSVKYGDAYLDENEEAMGGCSRQHMSPGLANKDDKGTGIGPCMYMAGPIVDVLKKRYSEACTFSPSQSSHRFASRSSDADAAWQNLVKAGVAIDTTESDETTNELDVPEQAMERYHGISNISHMEPSSVEVTYDEEVEIQVMNLDNVMKQRILLHATEEALEKINDKTSEVFFSPPPEAFAQIDLSRCDQRDLDKYINFCANDEGDEAENLKQYKFDAYEATLANPNKPANYRDPRQYEFKFENPRRKVRNPSKADVAWGQHITSSVWGDE